MGGTSALATVDLEALLWWLWRRIIGANECLKEGL